MSGNAPRAGRNRLSVVWLSWSPVLVKGIR